MATPPDPSKPNSPAPQYEQPNWNVHGPVINTPGPVHIVRPEQPAPPPDRERAKMMRQARRQVDDVLHKSLWNEAKIALRLAQDTARPYNVELQAPEHPPILLPQGKQLIEVYDQHQNLLLILGEPGGGKTTLLLELAEQLLDRAETDNSHPIPVVFNLSTWSKNQPELDEWMVAQLYHTYGVQLDHARAWVAAGQILPLLDGLDEVDIERRAACVEAINAYRRNHAGAWATPMVVCCRSEEYHTLPTLRFATVVTVQVLTHTEINSYLKAGGKALAGVRAILKDDPTLYDLLKTPLLLSMITLAFADTPAKELRASTTLEVRRTAILTAFVRRMFSPDPPGKGDDARYPRQRILRGLKWLAQRLDSNSQTLYLMESMQPDWVKKRWQRMLIQWSASLLLVGGGIGLIAIGGITFGITTAIMGGLVGAMKIKTITPTDAIQWDLKEVQKYWWIVLICSAYLSIGFGREAGIWGGIAGFGLGILYGGIVIGFRSIVMDTRMLPNEGIQRSKKHLLTIVFGSILVGFFSGIAAGFMRGPFVMLVLGLVGTILAFIIGSLGFAIPYGGRAVIQHYTLRLFLLLSGAMPWDIAALLEAAVRRSLLRRVGGGWVFTHRMLLEHFRDLSDKGLEELAKG